ncbi:translation initiation factor eIF-2B subunit beta [Telopea speciosissima]|uniref:translation initiation factor eIF-2B subunit beta n=1 Tax=Telopea speciosissima TaxID=54955 RepID=UPI001CC45679|nr:translation initiation factor eIF-2B subunit beta [Telopea speciosissima]XP_043714282.1 translation initiation factor eIF-2B subunit beta [Telopea speciosissima]XP_043714283.1 translation initiation factor eIF-2B subunit beta [Telopea speciosissima]XP_043714284.1 translation initiation factor eIF-2B subunit beta [Telopea speciosissima]
MPDTQTIVNDFVIKLKRRKVEGSQATAKQTAELLRSVISQQRVPHTNQAGALIEAVKAVGEQLIAANPVELAVGNIVRRVLHIIREENVSLATNAIGRLNVSAGSDDEDDDERGDFPVLSAAAVAAASRSTLRPPSLHALLEDMPDLGAAHHTSSSGGDSEGKSKSADKSSRSRKLKHDVIEAVNELIEDIDTCHEQIAEQAVEHIHHNEVILTLGSSRTVMEFLCAAKEKQRSFRVFVAEGGPRYQGHSLAKELVARGLQTTVITDSAVFAMISRVNMVIVGAHAIMANGGVVAPVGLNMVALAAKKHAVPFVVVAGSLKLCPLYPHNPEVLLNDLRSPSELLDFGEFSDCMDFGCAGGAPLLHVVNPAFDYVPPNLVSLFITDTGGHPPSYMYRLIADYYSADDFVVQKRPASGN